MDWAEDIIERLASFTLQQQLARQAEESWRACFVNEGGEIGGWRVEEVSGRFRSQTLCFENALLSYPFITTSVDLFGPAGDEIGEEIGQYRLITLLDGETDDDYLEIDCTWDQYQERHSR